MRLVNGDEEHEGTLEICFQNTWTRICSSSYFDNVAAQVVCNQLGHPSLGSSNYTVFDNCNYYNTFIKSFRCFST